jgi:hypothetical protein
VLHVCVIVSITFISVGSGFQSSKYVPSEPKIEMSVLNTSGHDSVLDTTAL